MNYAELVAAVAINAGVTQKQARDVIGGAVSVIRENMRLGSQTAIPNLGTFAMGKAKSYIGRNPRTGDAMRVKAMKIPRLKISPALRKAVN